MALVDKLLILAVAAQVLLTLGILVWMGFERVPRVARGEIAVKDIAVERQGYPLRARLLSNNFDNQFQLPVAGPSWRWPGCSWLCAMGMRQCM